jgi:hypothetical protein
VECCRSRAPHDCSLSKLKVPEWIDDRIKEGTLENLRDAVQMDAANARLIAHFGLALANFAYAEEVQTMPDERVQRLTLRQTNDKSTHPNFRRTVFRICSLEATFARVEAAAFSMR